MYLLVLFFYNFFITCSLFIQGLDESDQKAVDAFLLKLDGTENKGKTQWLDTGSRCCHVCFNII